MDISREIKTLRSSLITVKSSLEQTRSPALHYLTKELAKRLASLNKIDQLLNMPNATKEDFNQVLEDKTASSFTLVFDNREALTQVDLSIFKGTKSVKSNDAQNPQPSQARQSLNSSVADSRDRTPPAELLVDPLE